MKFAFVESHQWHFSIWHVFDSALDLKDLDEVTLVPNAVHAWPNFLWQMKYRLYHHVHLSANCQYTVNIV